VPFFEGAVRALPGSAIFRPIVIVTWVSRGLFSQNGRDHSLLAKRGSGDESGFPLLDGPAAPKASANYLVFGRGDWLRGHDEFVKPHVSSRVGLAPVRTT
jgi:hypothetical protein